MYVHVRDQNDNATHALTRWVPTVRHFLACKDVAGGSQQSGGNNFFVKYGGPSDGSLLSGGGTIIFRIIRRHFLAATVDLAVRTPTRCHIDLAGNTSYHFAASRTVFPRVSPY